MAKLLIALLYTSDELKVNAESSLIKEFGPVFDESQPYDFDITDYYEKEFGKNLSKKIIVFEKEINKKDLIEIREKTQDIETKLSKNSKRTVNIDPGYISYKELILATKKLRRFKQKLNEEIFTHKILEFEDDEIITFYHTFADYKLEKNIEFFKKIKKSIQ